MKKFNYKGKIRIVFLTLTLMLLSSVSGFAFTEVNVPNGELNEIQEDFVNLEGIRRINDEDTQIILKELNLKETELSDNEKVAILTRGAATVWNGTYKKQYNIKKSFSMSANLNAGGTKPYTTFKITNKGKTKITAIAYKGSLGGSKTIRTVTVAANSSKTLKVTRADIIKYGTINGQGNTSILSYSVSLYNTNGNAISCAVKGVRYD